MPRPNPTAFYDGGNLVADLTSALNAALDYVDEVKGRTFDVRTYGAKGDVKILTDAAITAGSANLTSATAGFTSADIGKRVFIRGAGATLSMTGNTTSGSNVVTLTAVAGYADPATAIGQNNGVVRPDTKITGAGIPAGTYIQSVEQGGSLLLSQNATATATGVTLTLSNILGATATTISSVTNSTTVVLSANATVTVTAEKMWYGTSGATEDAARDAAFTACSAAGGGTVIYPAGSYFTQTAGLPPANVNVRGDGSGRTIIIRTAGIMPFQWLGAQRSTVSLTANAPKGTQTLSVPTTGIKAGDWMELRHGDGVSVGTTGSTSISNEGEMVQVQAVLSSTSLSLVSPTVSRSYTSGGSGLGSFNARVSPLDMVDQPQLSGIGFSSIGCLTTDEKIGYASMKYCIGAMADDVAFERTDQFALEVNASVQTTIRNPFFKDMLFVGSTYLGYGILMRGPAQWLTVIGANSTNHQVFNNGGNSEGFPRFAFVQATASQGDPGLQVDKAAISTHNDGEWFSFDVEVNDWNSYAFFLEGDYFTVRARMNNVAFMGIQMWARSATVYPKGYSIIIEKAQNIWKEPTNLYDGSAIHVQGTDHSIRVVDARDIDGHVVRCFPNNSAPSSGHSIRVERAANWNRSAASKRAVSLASGVTNVDIISVDAVDAASSQVVGFDGGTANTGCRIGSVYGRNVSALYGANEAWATKPTVVEATNGPQGLATLVAGTVTVANTSVTANSRIRLNRQTTGGTVGHLSVTKTAGTSFVINSSSATETSTVLWELIN